jgi:hypothetical protein
MNNKNKIHVGQQMLDEDFVKQPQMRKRIQTS